MKINAKNLKSYYTEVLYVKDVNTDYKRHVFVSKYMYNKVKKGQLLYLVK